MDAERLHGYTLTVFGPNENINGVYLDTQPDAIVITQSACVSPPLMVRSVTE